MSDSIAIASPAEIVRAYHAHTKHQVGRYAPGPETLDWDGQPNPYRWFEGAPRIALELAALSHPAQYGALFVTSAVAQTPVSLAAVALLLELSFGLSAWKVSGPDRWAVRCNPSSGNLHPTEAYVLVRNVDGLADGLYHYLSQDHALELRCRAAPIAVQTPQIWVGLASIHWREAWKYGERAFRYCQLDAGHALGALRYACAVLGWAACPVDDVPHAALDRLLGLDREADYGRAEPEDADVLVCVGPSAQACALPANWHPIAESWRGQANTLDRRHMYRWPAIDEVARATRHAAGARQATPMPRASGAARSTTGQSSSDHTSPAQASSAQATSIILGRRSALRFNPAATMPAATFLHLADRLGPHHALPWDVANPTPRIHVVFFVHRVAGLAPGLYALPRSPHGENMLRRELDPAFVWRRDTDGAPALLVERDVRSLASRLCCHQGIAGQSCFSLAMLGEFDTVTDADPAAYRQLFWEAGLIGHSLYMEAEAAGYRGTGIGCFFDDDVHAALGIQGRRLQSLYHFTVGVPVKDPRITTEPAYPGRPDSARKPL